jgi:hypothetical protein
LSGRASPDAREHHHRRREHPGAQEVGRDELAPGEQGADQDRQGVLVRAVAAPEFRAPADAAESAAGAPAYPDAAELLDAQ